MQTKLMTRVVRYDVENSNTFFSTPMFGSDKSRVCMTFEIENFSDTCGI